MDKIIDFFEWHGFLPTEKFERGIGREILKNRKRMDAVVAIIRDIEKHQTKPTTAMLELLFEKPPQRRPGPAPNTIGRQRADPQREAFIKKVEGAIALECENTDLKIALKQSKAEYANLLTKQGPPHQ